MTQLRYLNLSGARISSLAPIAAMPQLAKVKANCLNLSDLPQAQCPALLQLDILSTNLSAKSVKQFRALNPHCQVNPTFNEALQSAIKQADCIHVRWSNSPDILAEERDAEAIQALITHLAVDEPPRGSHICDCRSQYQFDFRQNVHLLTTIDVVCNCQRVGWYDWTVSQADLYPQNARFVHQWLRQHGVDVGEQKILLKSYIPMRWRMRLTAPGMQFVYLGADLIICFLLRDRIRKKHLPKNR